MVAYFHGTITILSSFLNNDLKTWLRVFVQRGHGRTTWELDNWEIVLFPCPGVKIVDYCAYRNTVNNAFLRLFRYVQTGRTMTIKI